MRIGIPRSVDYLATLIARPKTAKLAKPTPKHLSNVRIPFPTSAQYPITYNLPLRLFNRHLSAFDRERGWFAIRLAISHAESKIASL